MDMDDGIQWINSLAQSISDLYGTSSDYLISSPWREPTNTPAHVVDVGGSTIRIAKVDNYKVTFIHKKLIDDSARQNPLDWLAETINSFNLPPFALCWAFPLIDGNLCPMGKGWNLQDRFIGCSLAKELNTRLKSPLCCAVIHDAVASLVAENAANPTCKISLTWGTGINIAFKSDNEVINTEIGMAASPPYGDYIARKGYDEMLLAGLPGNMLFEYMTGGAYLGKLYSLAIGQETDTSSLWGFIDKDPVAEEIVERACYFVAAAVHAVAQVVSDSICTVAYTGGVIFETAVLSRLHTHVNRFSGILGRQIELVPQSYGPEIGAALVFPHQE